MEVTSTMTDVAEQVTTTLGTVATALLGIVKDVVPVVLPVLGAVMIVTFGVKIFRKIAK